MLVAQTRWNNIFTALSLNGPLKIVDCLQLHFPICLLVNNQMAESTYRNSLQINYSLLGNQRIDLKIVRFAHSVSKKHVCLMHTYPAELQLHRRESLASAYLSTHSIGLAALPMISLTCCSCWKQVVDFFCG